MQINRWLHLSISFWGIPLRGDLLSKKNRPEEFLFITATYWIILAVPWSVIHFFASNSPIFRKSLNMRKEQIARQFQSICFASKRNKWVVREFTLKIDVLKNRFTSISGSTTNLSQGFTSSSLTKLFHIPL